MRTSRVPIKEGTTILEALELAYLVEGKSYTPDQIRELNQRADQFRRQGELEEALGCCRDAFELVQDGELWAKYPDKLEGYAEGLVHMHYGTVYLAYGEKKLDAALGYYSASEQAFESLNKHYSQAVALMAQGTVHALQGDLRESWKHNELSLRVFGPSEPLDDALVRLKLIIKEQSEAAKSRYPPQSATNEADFQQGEWIDSNVFDIREIRNLILRGFTPQELLQFCQDHSAFRPMLDRFGPNSSMLDMAFELIEYCRKRMLFPELLSEVKEYNPRQYKRYESELHASRGPTRGRKGKSPAVRCDAHREPLFSIQPGWRYVVKEIEETAVFHGHGQKLRQIADEIEQRLIGL